MHFMQSADFKSDERLVFLETFSQLAESDYYVCQPIGPIGPIWSGPGEVEIELKRISGRKGGVVRMMLIPVPWSSISYYVWAYARSQFD